MHGIVGSFPYPSLFLRPPDRKTWGRKVSQVCLLHHPPVGRLERLRPDATPGSIPLQGPPCGAIDRHGVRLAPGESGGRPG